MRLLAPNHVTLIEACYPPFSSAGPDFLPKSQETSRLVYYASNRPGKIDKLGSELEKKAIGEVSKVMGVHTRSRASLLVTLAILRTLATECRRDLALLTPYLMRTLTLVFQNLSEDLEVIARAASVFTTWCTYTDGSLIGVNDGVTRAYFHALKLCCGFCVSPSNNSKDEEMWSRKRLVGLATIAAIVQSEMLYKLSSEFQLHTDLIIPVILENLREANLSVLEQEAFGMKTQPPQTSSYMAHFHPPITTERRTHSLHAHVDGVKGPSATDVIRACLHILFNLFQRSRAIQVSHCLSSSFDYMERVYIWKQAAFCMWYIQKSTEWSQYQYRYSVPSKIVERIGSIQDSSDSLPHGSLLKMLHSVLTSPTPLVNISTSDINSQLISFLLRRTSYDPSDETLLSTVNCIASLATHIYYTDQIYDLVHELISRMSQVQMYGSLGPNRQCTEESRIRSLRLLLSALEGLMRTAALNDTDGYIEHDSKVEPLVTPSSYPYREDGLAFVNEAEHSGTKQLRRTKIDPEIWQDSLTMLCEADTSIRATYSHQLVRFLQTELPKENVDFDGALSSYIPSRPPISDSTMRFLHALHASVFSLATSVSIDLPSISKPLGNSRSNDRDSESPPDSTSRPTFPDQFQQTGTAERKPLSHELSKGWALASNVNAPLYLEDPMDTSSDYVQLSSILTAVHQHLPIRSLLTGVPMLLALDSHIRNPANWVNAPSQVRTKAIQGVLLSTWKVIGLVWRCPELTEYLNKAAGISDSSIAALNESCLTPYGTVDDEASKSLISNQITFDYDFIISVLASNSTVQRATGLDRETLIRKTGREWTMEVALRDSVERFTNHESSLTMGPSPLIKLSPQLMQIENLSLSSLARSIRGIGAGDLREALEGRGSTSVTRLTNASASTLERYSSPNHENRAPFRRVRSRGTQSFTPIGVKGGPNDIRELFSKIGLGKESSNSLLKASFPPIRKNSPRAQE